MSINKNEIPILEFDNDTSAVIMPDHEKFDVNLPEKCVYAFVGEYIYKYAKEHGGHEVMTFVSETKLFPVYVIKYRGEDICLCQAPVGAAASAQILDWLIGYGVRKIISAGSCGTLTNIDEGVFLVPRKALRDEGTSYHYMPPSRFVDINLAARTAIGKALSSHGISYREVITWSTDGFYRETRAKVDYRRKEGCETVEMECSALAACADMRHALFGIILYTADTLANADKYDMRNFGGSANEYSLLICLDALTNL